MNMQRAGAGSELKADDGVWVISRETFRILFHCAMLRRWDLWRDCTSLLYTLFRLYLIRLIVPGLAATVLGVTVLTIWLLHGRWWMFVTLPSSLLLGGCAGAFLGRLKDRGTLRALVHWLKSKTADADDPPRAAGYLLLLVPHKYRENLVGDLEEEYLTYVLPTYGRWRANLWYRWQVAAALCHFLFHLLAGLASVWKLIR